MTQEQLDRLAAGLESSVKPYIDGLVERAVAKIPHMIQEEMASAVGDALRRHIREVLDRRLTITIAVSDK